MMMQFTGTRAVLPTGRPPALNCTYLAYEVACPSQPNPTHAEPSPLFPLPPSIARCRTWPGSDLSPPNSELLTQQGGTLVLSGQDLLYKHVDSGILKYTDVDEVLQAALSADYTSPPIDLQAPGGPTGQGYTSQ